jgi:2-phosphosulfolactate phosphatase
MVYARRQLPAWGIRSIPQPVCGPKPVYLADRFPQELALWELGALFPVLDSSKMYALLRRSGGPAINENGGGGLEIRRATLDTCANETGTVIVIDVIRAFTTAAFAFAAGARDIALVSSIDEAFALRKCAPGLLLMGEEGGRPVPGFDFGNSPAALVEQDLSRRRLVQRTSQGTQGVVRSRKATELLAASFVCAGATARYVRRSAPDMLSFVITGARLPGEGDEDAACADYLEQLLRHAFVRLLLDVV